MILVTGATGNIGSEVGRLLARQGHPCRLASRHTPQDRPLDFTRPETFAPALEGCRSVLLIRPPQISNTKDTLVPFIAKARKAGVRHILFISVAGAATKRWVPHHAVEQALITGPPGWTILRPDYFSQNLGGALRKDLKDHNRIFLPSGRGKVSFIDTRDLAEIAVKRLTNPAPLTDGAFELHGPESLDFHQVAALLTRELKRPIHYQAASIPAYLLHLRRQGTPLAPSLVFTILHAAMRSQKSGGSPAAAEELLEKPLRSLADYLHDHRELWL